jgi:hypothetical protein
MRKSNSPILSKDLIVLIPARRIMNEYNGKKRLILLLLATLEVMKASGTPAIIPIFKTFEL